MAEMGDIVRVTRTALTVLSMDVPLDLADVQEAWPKFEASLESLKGRQMMGLVLDREGIYRLATSKLDRDRDHAYGLRETVVPGGDYLRLTLVGNPPEVYSLIGTAFDSIFEQAAHDPERPLIEFYRREGEIDCLVPVST